MCLRRRIKQRPSGLRLAHRERDDGREGGVDAARLLELARHAAVRMAGCSPLSGRLQCAAMLARLLQFVLVITLLFAPICVMDSGAATAMHHRASSGEQQVMTADAGHCADVGDEREDEQERSADLDCRTTCSGVLAQMPILRGSLAVSSVPQNMALAAAEPGMNPAADPPPPRLS